MTVHVLLSGLLALVFKSGIYCISGIPLPETNSDVEADEKELEAEPLYTEQADDGLKPVSIENLWNYVKEKKNSKTNGLKQEYDVSICFLYCRISYSIGPMLGQHLPLMIGG